MILPLFHGLNSLYLSSAVFDFFQFLMPRLICLDSYECDRKAMYSIYSIAKSDQSLLSNIVRVEAVVLVPMLDSSAAENKRSFVLREARRSRLHGRLHDSLFDQSSCFAIRLIPSSAP